MLQEVITRLCKPRESISMQRSFTCDYCIRVMRWSRKGGRLNSARLGARTHWIMSWVYTIRGDLILSKQKQNSQQPPVLRRGCLERLIYQPMPPFGGRGSVGRLAHKALILITRSRSIHLLALIENSPILCVHCLPHAAGLMAEICFAAPAIQAAF